MLNDLFYEAANAIFGKIGRLASQITSHLIKSMPENIFRQAFPYDRRGSDSKSMVVDGGTLCTGSQRCRICRLSVDAVCGYITFKCTCLTL